MATLNLSHLLKKPIGEIKKPDALPAADYPGIIKGFKFDNANQKKTPYVEFDIGLMAWPDDLSADERLAGVDITKRQMRKQYYLSEEALWRLVEFIKTTSVSIEGNDLETVIPELVGQRVMAKVTQGLSQKTNEIYNNIDELIGHG